MLRKLLTKLPVTSILLGLPGLHVLGQDVEAQLLVGFGFVPAYMPDTLLRFGTCAPLRHGEGRRLLFSAEVQRESEAYHAQCRGSQAEHSNLSALPKA